MKIAIVDNFKKDRIGTARCIERFLREQEAPQSQFSFFSNGETFLSALSQHRFDFVFMECYLNGINGIETARQMRCKDPETSLILMALYDNYAIEGYFVAASGYLLKPYSYEHFSKVFSLAYSHVTRVQQVISFKVGEKTKRVLADDIVYCDTDNHYIQIHLYDNTILRIRMSFRSLITIFSVYPQFIECYRGCLINLAHTIRMEELNFLMDIGVRVPFRKKARRQLFQTFSDYQIKQSLIPR